MIYELACIPSILGGRSGTLIITTSDFCMHHRLQELSGSAIKKQKKKLQHSKQADVVKNFHVCNKPLFGATNALHHSQHEKRKYPTYVDTAYNVK
jgi:hypothetical protein